MFNSKVDESALLSDINPTPLIDVLLVLLIVLIIALPLATHRTSVDMPSPGGALRPTVTVEIEFDGSIYCEGQAVADLPTLERYLIAAARQEIQPNVLIDANARARYDTVAKVLATAQRTGIQRIGFARQERFVEQP